MSCRSPMAAFLALTLLSASTMRRAVGQDSSSSGSHPGSSHTRLSKTARPTALDPGSVGAGLYRNSGLGLSYKLPQGWVLRTEGMTRGDSDCSAGDCGQVLLAAFSRPPEARAEDVNSSIVIAAEKASTYPGLSEAAQYFGPLTEVARAQGFAADEEPYGFDLDKKRLVRGDFRKNVGTRVMHQSTLVLLARGYVVSFTFIGGTEDEVEDLIQGLAFNAPAKPANR